MRKMFGRPFHDFHQKRIEFIAFSGKGVFIADGVVLISFFRDNFFLFKMLKALG